MNIKERQNEILEDTVAYYSKNINRRCVDGEQECYYNPADIGKQDVSEGCAIGRYMTQEQKEEADADSNVRILPDHILPAAFKGLGINFLSLLQHLHDSSHYWEEKGLSDIGKKLYNEIKLEYCTE